MSVYLKYCSCNILTLLKSWLHAKNQRGSENCHSTATMKRYFCSSCHELCVPHWCRELSSLNCLIFSILLCVCVFCLLLLHTLPVSSHSQTQSEHAQLGWPSWNSKMFMNTNEAAARPPALSSVFRAN